MRCPRRAAAGVSALLVLASLAALTGALPAAASTSWTPTSVAAPSGTSAIVDSVTCTSATSCVAVGYYRDASSNQQPLVLADSAGSWSAAAAPVPSGAASNPQAELGGLTCPSATTCFAGGAYRDSSGYDQALLESDSSGTWSASEVPLPAGASTGYQNAWVNAIACTSATSCVALGHYQDQAGDIEDFIDTDTAGSWSDAEAPLPAGAEGGGSQSAWINAVTCVSATSCVAIGEYLDGSDNVQGMALTDSSGSWSAQKTPVPAGAASDPLAQPGDIACASATSCVATGVYYDSAERGQGLILTDSSGTWSAQKAPLPAGAAANPGAEVGTTSCPSATSCVSIASYDDSSGDEQVALLTDSSGSWSAAKAPLPPGAASNPQAEPYGLVCASATSCDAIGSYTDTSGNGQGLLLSDSSGTWSASTAPLPASPAPAADPGTIPRQLTCPSATTCVVVGEYGDASGNTDILVETSSAGGCSPSSGASACTMTTALSVQGGTLSVESSPSLYWDEVLNGYDQWATASASALAGCAAGSGGTTCSGGTPAALEVVDATGSGAGWALSAYLSSSDLPSGSLLDFAAAGSSVGSSVVAPLASYPFASSAPVTTCDRGSACTLPTPAASCSHAALGFTSCPSYPVDLGPATSATSQVDLYSAAASSGIGSVCFASGSASGTGCAGATPDADFDLAVPAGAPAGTLATTVVVLTVSSGP